MSDSIVLTLPDDVAARAKRIAEKTSQPIEQVLLDHLRTLSALLPELPPDEQAELGALHQLSDDALWTIAREQMPEEVQQRAHDLMERNAPDLISDDEAVELETLVARADRLLLRKAEAASLLRKRGYTFSQQDFRPQDA
ncbi:MAG: hypothetical protein ABI700_02970 [Chloroflexota bacterium]